MGTVVVTTRATYSALSWWYSCTKKTFWRFSVMTHSLIAVALCQLSSEIISTLNPPLNGMRVSTNTS